MKYVIFLLLLAGCSTLKPYPTIDSCITESMHKIDPKLVYHPGDEGDVFLFILCRQANNDSDEVLQLLDHIRLSH